jgi:heme exporter protein D
MVMGDVSSSAMAGYAGFMVVFTLLLLVIAVLWILMPFAIFGTKGILRDIVTQLREQNRLLREIKEAGIARAVPPPAVSATPPGVASSILEQHGGGRMISRPGVGD